MIKLTRLNGEEFVVNAELIQSIESRPDTFITLTSDDRLIVRESVEEVVKRSIAYSRAIRSGTRAVRTDSDNVKQLKLESIAASSGLWFGVGESTSSSGTLREMDKATAGGLVSGAS